MARLLEEIREDVTDLLSKLITIDTTNPPGNETAAAKFLAEYLKKDGLECEVVESAPERGSVITRIKGDKKSRSLLLLSHLDVVAAAEKEWAVPPFSGTVKDNFVWGRGAIDIKSLVAVEAMVMKLLFRERVKLKGDVIFAATADEEKGGKYGVAWLAENHLEKIRADYVINEGGGFSFPIGSKHIFTIETAQKGVMWLKIRAKGTPGHGSIPGAADNAVLRMAKVSETLGNYRSKIRPIPAVKQMIDGLAKERGRSQMLLSRLIFNSAMGDTVLDRMAKKDRATAEFLRALLRNTIAPTMINGGIKENIIPSACEAVFDCRILPGETKETLLEETRRALSKAKVDLEKLEFEFITADEPSDSPLDTPLYRTIQKVVKRFEPDSYCIPIMMTGGTDSRFLRQKGCVCYGFAPMKTDVPLSELLSMAHGINERISIDNLVFGVSVLYELVKEICT